MLEGLLELRDGEMPPPPPGETRATSCGSGTRQARKGDWDVVHKDRVRAGHGVAHL